MTSVSLPAYAKINLTLDVLARRPDGYHEIRSVMQTLALHDTLDVALTPDTPGVLLEVVGAESAGVPDDESNIVHNAAVRLQKIAAARGVLPGSRSGLHITLTKRVPSQAGLGGGSSDAAAALKAIDRLLGLALSHERLNDLAASLGADVPFFLTGGTALVEGLGERVTPLPPFTAAEWMVLVKPPVGVATAQAYAVLDALPDRVSARTTSRWGQTEPPRLGNDFQPVIRAAHPEIAVALDVLQSESEAVCGPILCGSGAAVFQVVRNEQAAHRLAAQARGAGVGKVWVTRTQGRQE